MDNTLTQIDESTDINKLVAEGKRIFKKRQTLINVFIYLCFYEENNLRSIERSELERKDLLQSLYR